MGTRTVSQTINLSTPNTTGKYITDISNNNGIQVHAINNVNSNYTQIDSNGLTVYQGTIDVAQFGANGARLGKLSGAHSVIDADGQRFYASDGTTQLANIGYGQGQGESSIVTAPYYTFGIRASGSTVGAYSLAEGNSTIASDYCAHAEGYRAEATGQISHAENRGKARGEEAHAENAGIASGFRSHAEGAGVADNDYSHAEGYLSYANAPYSHVNGLHVTTKRTNEATTCIGKYNDPKDDTAFEIGNGTADNARSNALTVDWNGNVTRGDGASYTAVQITRWS